ncbi:MAG: peptidoglycan-binding protein [Candidatus Thiodiazotropha taylori]|uniref:Peptidoglycan-binding protein n=1 Tax=Candidatus Thiodiazotropha taylori TaxID=2792791 RepID=A0A9E4P8K3_9GAMM|nr:peptidoglycan-binding protein [Candidatus Thiodiazotropha taylori]MCG7962243.1 peptidoglycan-binding protein [Candidatus Thiodiazotropha endolucinida]MCG7955927.1 peptidoglycan-binding protein [Candidatus Thiodiazotropha taylori]MCG7966160.1 peptidoglycan-binding protein [Candidatus Thiodiazotropha taylori]MCG8029249.1 peptidoglycan-binding protein [Candidatus Thiodiazotropha taylori]
MEKADLPDLGDKGNQQHYGRKKYPQRGTSGLAVAYVQNLLNARTPPPPLWVDGIFGPKTDSRVKQYQASRRLVVDGIVGPMTLASLEAGPPAIRKRPGAASIVVPATGGV